MVMPSFNSSNKENTSAAVRDGPKWWVVLPLIDPELLVSAESHMPDGFEISR